MLIPAKKMTTKEAFTRFIACSDIDILKRKKRKAGEQKFTLKILPLKNLVNWDDTYPQHQSY